MPGKHAPRLAAKVTLPGATIPWPECSVSRALSQQVRRLQVQVSHARLNHTVVEVTVLQATLTISPHCDLCARASRPWIALSYLV